MGDEGSGKNFLEEDEKEEGQRRSGRSAGNYDELETKEAEENQMGSRKREKRKAFL